MFLGRENGLKQLDSLWRKSTASLVTCRGRRRIGKLTLIEEFARRSGARFLKLEGDCARAADGQPGPAGGLSRAAVPSGACGYFDALVPVSGLMGMT